MCVCRCVPGREEGWREGGREREKLIEIYCRELAYVIIKSYKSQDLLSVAGDPEEQCVVPI